MLEMQLRKPYLNTNFQKTRDSRYTYQNQLDKACFQHNMTYWLIDLFT